MRSTFFALVAGAALLALSSTAWAMGGQSYSGPVGGTYTANNGNVTGSFQGYGSGNAASAQFTGDMSSWVGSGTQVIGYSPDGSIGFRGTYFNSGPNSGYLSGITVFWTPEPLAGLAVGLGLLGARLLRRR